MRIKTHSQTAALILGSLSWRLSCLHNAGRSVTTDFCSAEICHDDATSAFTQQRFDACIRRAIKGLAYANPQAAQRAQRVRNARCIRA